MCLMITKPAEVKIKREYLTDAFKRNGDGAGIAVADGSRVIVIRPLWKVEDMLKVYDKFQDHPMLLHMRLATHGGKTHANTHPHPITKTMAMGHNGQIHKVSCLENESDTRAFIRLHVDPVLKAQGQAGIVAEETLKKFDAEIGMSKLAFLDSIGNFSYVGKNLGHEHEGCWWSNNTYKQERPVYSAYDHYDYRATKPYYNHAACDYKLEIHHCVCCKSGHQRRNCDGMWLTKNEASLLGLKIPSTYGESIYFCHGCMKLHGMPRSPSGWAHSTMNVAELPPAIKEAIASHIDLLHVEAAHAGADTAYIPATETCYACGLSLPTDCHQTILDPTIKGAKVVRHICRYCVAKTGRKQYYTTKTIGISKKDSYWRIVQDYRAKAAAACYREHPEFAPTKKSFEFPAWIKKANNLFAKPEPQREKPSCVYVTGWACDMCGELRLTAKHPDGNRCCTTCHETWVDAGYNWDLACLMVTKQVVEFTKKLPLIPFDSEVNV